MRDLFRAVIRWASVASIIFALEMFTHPSTVRAALTFSNAELESLVEPIALYPDPLVQSMLAAATFPDQIVDAALLIQNKEDAAKIAQQSWDTSVKVIAGYPGVLSMMYRKLDWTTALGEAFINQHRELLSAIQSIRMGAAKSGELKSNEYQKVSTQRVEGEGPVVIIEPQDPQVIYVPSDPVYVHDDDEGNYDALVPLVSFGLGMAVGSALNDDDDHYYYGGGWGGPAYWYGGGAYDDWMDNRRALWEDRHDRAFDRQDARQDIRADRQDFRQESIREGTWNPPTADQRAAARTTATDRRTEAQSRAASARSNVQSSRPQTYGSGQYRSSAQSRGWSTQTAANRQGSSAFSGYGSRGQVGSYSSRGSASRSAAGFSRGGGGFSRGGGGGRRR